MDPKPWICAWDIADQKKIWEQFYNDAAYNDFFVYSAQGNGIGSCILELYNRTTKQSLLVSTDLMGRPAAQNSPNLPRRTDLNYQLGEVAGNFSAVIEPFKEVEITPPVLQIPRGQSGIFTVNGNYSSYQWYLNGEEISGESAKTYTLQTSSMSLGLYTVTAVVVTNDERRSGSYTVRVTN